MDIDMGSGFTKVKTDGNIGSFHKSKLQIVKNSLEIQDLYQFFLWKNKVGDVPTKLIKFDPIVSVDKTNIRAIVQNIH